MSAPTMATDVRESSTRRILTYLVISVGLCLLCVGLSNFSWQGSIELHTLMEVMAALVALFVGVVALVRFYTRKNNTFLFIGSGFVGAALLDGSHALVTSQWFGAVWPSPPPSLIPWSWNASRVFLALLMGMSWWAWKREERHGPSGIIREGSVYTLVGGLAVISFTFFALIPLPQAYYPAWFFSRPDGLVSAALFLAALVGYYHKGHWRREAFEHWVVLSLVVACLCETLFVSSSLKLFDQMFIMADVLKLLSYVCVLTGLLVSMAQLFHRAEKSALEFSHMNASLEAEVAQRRGVERELREIAETLEERVVERTREMEASRVDALATMQDAQRARHEVEQVNVALSREITERKRAEQQLWRINEQLGDNEQALQNMLADLRRSHDELQTVHLSLIQAEKMKSVGRLAAGTAHEVKNPLAIISQGIDYLKRHLDQAANDAGEVLEDMAEAVGRADTVVSGMLDFAAPRKLERELQNINDIVNQSMRLVKHELDSRQVKVARKLDPDVPVLLVDAQKLQQVFVNLFMNAIQAMPDGGDLLVRSYVRELVELGGHVGHRLGDRFSPGESVVVVDVEDSGTGIPEQKLGRVFDPFFTSKSSGEGTGLGLSVTLQILELHQALIELTNREEGGVRARILFKRMKEAEV